MPRCMTWPVAPSAILASVSNIFAVTATLWSYVLRNGVNDAEKLLRNEPNDQPTKQPANQPASQPTNKPNNQPTNLLIWDYARMSWNHND